MRAYKRLEKTTEVPMLVLAVVYLVLEVLPYALQIGPGIQQMLDGVSWIIWALFALELVAKIYLYPDRLRFLWTHWADILIVLLPFLRPLRLLKILVVLYRTWRRSRRLFRKRALNFVGLMGLLIVVSCSFLVMVFERGAEGGNIKTYIDALWWAVVTMTTVGYGDRFPVTPAGRGVAAFLMFTGITLFGLLTASVAAFFVDEEKEPADAELKHRIEALEKHVLEMKAMLREQHEQKL